jgi:hypothetical protein
MIRPDEITFWVLDDIVKCLNKYDYREIKLSENKPIFDSDRHILSVQGL